MKVKPTPVDEVIHVISGKPIMCKTDTDSIIEYANDYFLELSEYRPGELMGESIYLLQHPDMPRTILDRALNQALTKKKGHTIVKFISKTGKYFWLQIKFDYKVDEVTRDVSNLYFYATPVSRNSITELDKLYLRLSKIEKESSLEYSEKYFSNYLENLDLDYESFFEKYLNF